jgi:hypothetical protein
MGYMEADTMPKVGFRDYGDRNAFAAAHLSGLPAADPGLGAYFYNRPLDPWELHADTNAHLHGLGDLGQNHPFSEHAWQLHGLSLGDLGDVSDAVGQAVEEYVAAGKLTGDQASALMAGTNTFSDFGLPDPTDQSSWSSLLDLFRSVNNDLQNVEQQYSAAGASGQFSGNAAFVALGKTIVSNRQQYSNLASQFVQYYTMMTGSAPAGLSGLGILPVVVWVAGAAAFLITALAALYAIHTWAASVNVNQIKAQATQAQVTSTAATNQSLLQQLSVAQAKGDTVTAQAILKTLATTGAPPAAASQLETWLMNNAMWIGLGIAGIIVLGPVSQGLFGSRRR